MDDDDLDDDDLNDGSGFDFDDLDVQQHDGSNTEDDLLF